MATIKKYVKCPYCGSGCMTDAEISLVKFDNEENEVLQKECLRLLSKFLINKVRMLKAKIEKVLEGEE